GMGLPTTPPHPVIVLLNAACHYTRSLDYPATVEVALSVGRLGRSSLQTHYTLKHIEADAVCGEGYATLVWYDMQAQKSVPLPEQIRAACGVASA
ncbi:MAG: hypothetical protein OEV67_12560, partial [Betaproteobacteria bacterium]|nr:hypothetical protein [Betaproteobacteria bacterium]